MAADQEQPSTSSSITEDVANMITPEEKQEFLKTALNALVQGKRHLLVKDVPSAISSLGEACRLFTEVNGPFGPDNGEAHYFYGKALLEQSRLDLAIFEGPECAKVSESGDDESEEEEGESEDEETEGENAEVNGEAEAKKPDTIGEDEKMETNATEGQVDEGKGKLMEDEVKNGVTKAMENGTSGDASTNVTAEEDLNIPSPSDVKSKEGPADIEPSTSQGIKQPEVGEEEELGNLQLAWEVLEVAKVAYDRKLRELGEEIKETKTEADTAEKTGQIKELEKKMADTYLLLGEVATESEMYVEAVEEFKTGLNLLEKIEEPDSREIAQYFFQMGLAYSFGKSFAEAITSFKKSVEIIEQRIINLKEKMKKMTTGNTNKEGSEANVDTELSPEEKEIQELQLLLPELQEKINDTIDAESESKKSREEDTMEEEIRMRNSPVKNPNPPVANDISHLVKKRKKVEGEETPVEPPSKRVCNLFPQQDDVSSSTPANGSENVSV